MSGSIRIAIADDHRLFRSGMIALLEDSEGLEIAFEAENGRVLLEKLGQGPLPDVVLLDVTMPEMDGIEALNEIRLHFPSVKVLMLTMNQDNKVILRVMEAGANGYLLKESDIEEVELAIHAVVEAGFYFNDRVSRAMLTKLVLVDKFKPVFTGVVQLTEC
jgi:DNA-binding NarL/FixJ family response regulator